MSKSLTVNDKQVIALAERYVRLQLVDRKDHKEAVLWREYHEAMKRQLMTYPRKVS